MAQKIELIIQLFSGQYLFFLISTQRLIDVNQLAQNTQDRKTMQAAGKADEPKEAMREAARPVSLVHITMLNSF